MERIHITLTGMEAEYMKKLALYMKTNRSEFDEVSILRGPDTGTDGHGGRAHTGEPGSETNAADRTEKCSGIRQRTEKPAHGRNYGRRESRRESDTVNILAGSRDSLEEAMEDENGAIRIIFVEEPEEEEGNRVFAWQSAEVICRRILGLAKNKRKQEVGIMRSTRSRWTLILTTETKAAMLAFGATYAQILTGFGGVLMLNLCGISGMRRLFSLEEGNDLTDLILALRKRVCLTEEYTVQLGSVSCVLPPGNPTVLYEMSAEDTGRLIQAAEASGQYRNIVVLLGDYLQGTRELFRLSEKVICLSEQAPVSALVREELLAFYRSCGGDTGKWKDYLFRMPEITGTGPHLIYDWEQGALGTMIRTSDLLEGTL